MVIVGLAGLAQEAARPLEPVVQTPVVVAIGPTTDARLVRTQVESPLLLEAAAVPLNERLRLKLPMQRSRTGNVLLGGLIGSAAGVVVCTGISNLVKDEGTGFSTCTTSGYAAFIAGGFVVGALVGYLIK